MLVLPAAASFTPLNYGILFVYLAAMFACGVYFAGRQRTTDDYFLAGRNMPWLVVAMSMFASLTSATSYMGFPGRAFDENCSMLMVGVASLLVAPILVFVFYPFYRRLGVTTSFEYVEQRFGPPARFAASGLFLLARLGWLGVVVYSPALAISVVTGVNLYVAIVLMGVLSVAYTAIGGLAAVLWTDLLQFIILVAGAIWIAATLIYAAPDGAAGILADAQAAGKLFNWQVSPLEMSATVILLAYFFNHMQDYGVDQITVQRLMAIRDYRGMAKAAFADAIFNLAILALLLFIGLGLSSYYANAQGRLPEGLSGDKVVPFFIINELPNGVSGLLITALFAAAMSSVDSGVNSLATVVVHDFVRPLRRQVRSEADDLRLARILTVVFGGFAIGAACYAAQQKNILTAALVPLGLFTGPILALFLLGMLTRRGSFRAWCVAAAVAIAVTRWLQVFETADGQSIHFTWYFPCGFLVCLPLSVLLSLVLPGPPAPGGLTLRD